MKATYAREALDSTFNSPNNPNRSLALATMRAFGPSMLAPIVPRMFLLLLTFAQPLLVTDMISFTENTEIHKSRGWALVGGFVCVYGLMVLTTALYWEQVKHIHPFLFSYLAFELTWIHRGNALRFPIAFLRLLAVYGDADRASTAFLSLVH